MHSSGREAVELASALMSACAIVDDVDIVICPPFTALNQVVSTVRGSHISVGAQNCHWLAAGAFTGEIAVPMLSAIGCRYVIIGHSERRAVFGEDDEVVAAKLAACCDGGLTAILCVGETLEQREAGQTKDVVGRQISRALAVKGLTPFNFVVAYEPVWAIGTGRTATPELAQETHQQIRDIIRSSTDSTTADATRILYGGSVKQDNATSLFSMPDIDGGLIGGASLSTESFLPIIEAATGDSKCDNS